MTRVLVVHQDPGVADRMASDLRHSGHEAQVCGGPSHDACPLSAGLPCHLLDWADVLVYDAWVAGSSEGGRQLVSELRDTYVDLPVILTSADESLGWVEQDGPYRVLPIKDIPSAEALADAVDAVLPDQGMAV